jgi:hypothetical protein
MFLKKQSPVHRPQLTRSARCRDEIGASRTCLLGDDPLRGVGDFAEDRPSFA